MIRRIIIVLLLAALAAAVVFGIVHGYESWRGHVFAQGHAAGAAEVKQQWDDDRARAQAALIAQQKADADETLRRLEIQKRNDDAKAQRDAQIARDAAAARAAADGLRLTAAAYLHAAGCDGRTGDSAVECVRTATGNALDVLGKCTGEVASLASAADDARSRGLLCEQQYDSLTLKLSPAATP